MYIKKMMDKIVEDNNKYDMDCLGEMFIDMVDELKTKEPMKYKNINYKMHEIAYDGHLCKEEAMCWVDSMENKDGTTGQHWSWEQTEDVRKQYAPQINCVDWYIAINMMYSDYYSPKFDTSTYIQLAKDWLDDKDIEGNKTLKYYLYVVK